MQRKVKEIRVVCVIKNKLAGIRIKKGANQ